MNGASSNRGEFTTTPDKRDWTSAYWLAIRNRWLWKRLLVAVTLVWASYVVLMVGIDFYQYGSYFSLSDDIVLATQVSPLVVLALIGVTLALTPRRVGKYVRDSMKLAPQSHFEFDENGIRARNGISNSNLSWSQLTRVLDNRRVVVLMLTDQSMFIVRKAELAPGVEDALRRAIVAAGVPNR